MCDCSVFDEGMVVGFALEVAQDQGVSSEMLSLCWDGVKRPRDEGKQRAAMMTGS